MDYKRDDFIDLFCLKDTLKTYDPYDIWKTGLGLKVKNLFNNNKWIGGAPALIFSLFDLLINNSSRFLYRKQEYAIARAICAQILINKFSKDGDPKYLLAAKKHLNWLVQNKCVGYSGACWGLGFKWPAGKNVIYGANTPHVTHTPYALEAFHQFNLQSKGNEYADIIKSSYLFYEHDLQVMFENEEMLAISYGPFKDRIVTNAVSYAMFSYSIFLSYFPGKEEYIKEKIFKFFRFIQANQNQDGSWLYSTDDKNSFIDCFHSCFVIKNLIKVNKIFRIEGMDEVIEKGYQYICNSFYDEKMGLYKRFTVQNKLSLVRYDLYDNAEVLNIAILLNDQERVQLINNSINKHFVMQSSIFSVIDFLGIKRNKNMLRWAVMPYLYTQSLK